jgi:CRP-like cAMP-binding protein
MNQQILAQVLGQLRFSAPLPAEAVGHLAAAASLRGFPGGTELFRENSQNNELMIISIGRVALDMYVPGRGNVRILSLGPGDVVAWSALLGGGRMTTSAQALEDTQVVAIAADVILSVCESNHTFGYQLMRRVASSLGERLLATRLQLLDLFSESSPTTPWEPQIQ